MLAIVCYSRGVGWRVLAVVAVFLAGASAAKIRVDRLIQPEIGAERFVALSGRVVDIESRVEFRPRIVLDQIHSELIESARTPGRVRITLPRTYELPTLGARVTLNTRLASIPGAIVPGGYDPHRSAFFEGIGGSGFSLGEWVLEEEPPHFSVKLLVARVRAWIVTRIMSAQPGEAGAVASALLVGERSALSEATNENLRISGLFHILSISGLHMMLVAGTVFFAIRAMLALSPRLALKRPVRKWAAGSALLVLTIYFALSGGGAATVRAYAMASIMLMAMLVDRPAISMRNLAIAAFLVLTIEPEGVMEPGFQMSFAAVAALIAAWEFWRERRASRLTDDDVVPGFWLARLAVRPVVGVLLTTLIAGVATAPFAAYHFERVATYSLLGNLLAAPLVSAVIMPFGLLSLALLPLGLEAVPLGIMGWGIETLLGIAAFVAALPGADVRPPQLSSLSLCLIAAGLTWLCLWRLRWRLLGVPAMLLGIALIPALLDPPDIFVSPDGQAVAVRDVTGVLRVSGARAGSYRVDQFFDEEDAQPASGNELRNGVTCDRAACLLTDRTGNVVSHVLEAQAFGEDCRRASVIASSLIAPTFCQAPLIIDAPKLAQLGAHAVRIRGTSSDPVFDVETALTANPRPWEGRRGQ
jgi:competence protein ComEC